jgi:hypothetical protein
VPDLRSSNVKWSGRRNHYRGIVDGNEVDELRARFPNKVTVEAEIGQTSSVLNDQMMKDTLAADADPLKAGRRNERLAAEESQEQSTEAASGGPPDSVEPDNAAKPDAMPHAAKDDQGTRPKPYGSSPFSRLPSRKPT